MRIGRNALSLLSKKVRANVEAERLQALFRPLHEAPPLGYGLPLPVAEYRFHPERRWRFDYAWPDYRLALEVEGGVWTAGRHTRGSGFIKDMEKYNAAAVLGWRIIRVTPEDLRRVRTFTTLKEALLWHP